MIQERITQSLQEHQSVLEDTLGRHGEDLARLAACLVEVFHQGGRLIVLGSGQFAAVADLVASLFNFRLSLERPLLPVLSLSQDALLALALARDGRFEQYFVRQLRVLGGGGDVVLALCGSSPDPAVAEALVLARQNGSRVAVLFQGRQEDYAGETPDYLLSVESDSPACALEAFLFCGRTICQLVEAELFGL
ncbi:D-sedoheptulose-7-phosphate isomerase [Geoalkalibacter sp.]|uniref:D-sedoheptulose-7-phosphate isomerase n=1 Tax=Geoalkalibacter sp. TaxID=3041440 RepID=UPI00272ECB7D|nr:SIS domain-containing protein [Geoalkalibacter sp.]